MNVLLKKEMRLSALLLTYLFIGFGVMTLVPGYPILCGAFFITLGIFQSFFLRALVGQFRGDEIRIPGVSAQRLPHSLFAARVS